MAINNSDEELLAREILRLNGNILGLVLGILCGLIIFAATNLLLIKGGNTVGRHLSLLNQLFIGYSVSLVGSFIGMAYGFFSAYLAGRFIAWSYNYIVVLRDRSS